jgi:hypothetical protein
VKRLAQREGWALSDLVRMLIVLGATVCWLRLRNQEDLDRLVVEIAHAGQMADMLNEAVSHKSRTRGYPLVRPLAHAGRTTDVVTLILPDGYASLIEAYAATSRMSKSNTCERLLTFGLVSHLTAENSIHQAVQSVRAQPENQAAPQIPM